MTAIPPRSAPAHPGWSVEMLGGFGLFSPEGLERTLGARGQRLVAYLAVCGTSPRIVVAEALWPGATPPHARSSLRTTVRQVRHDCPTLLLEAVEPLALSRSTVVDVDRVRGDDAHLRAADLLVDAELLPGWYEDWVLFERDRLRLQRLLLLENRARQVVSRDPALALTLAARVVELDPLRESAQRALVEVHLAMGNRVEALRVYREFRSRSIREFGVGPSPQMESLVEGLHAEQQRHLRPRLARSTAGPGVGPRSALS